MATLNKDIFITVDGERKKLEGDQLDQFLAQKVLDQADTLKRETEAKTRATAKAALLDRLGITEDEAKLLLA